MFSPKQYSLLHVYFTALFSKKASTWSETVGAEDPVFTLYKFQ